MTRFLYICRPIIIIFLRYSSFTILLVFICSNGQKRDINSQFLLRLNLLFSPILVILHPSVRPPAAQVQGLSASGEGSFIVNNTGNMSTPETSSTTNTSSSPSTDQTLSLQSFVGTGGNNISNNNDTYISFLTYENPIYKISIEYPSSWTYREPEDESSANTTIFSVIDIAPPIPEDPNIAKNFQIGIEDLELSLDQYVRTVINSYRGNLALFLLMITVRYQVGLLMRLYF